jgi:hypothetical protein
MKIRSLSPFYLFFGLACGVLLGTFLGHEASVTISKIVFFLSIIVIAIFGKQIDAALHNFDLQDWHILRNRSKWYFVLTRFILLRGIVLFTLFALPMVSGVTFSTTVFIALAISFIVIVAIVTYFGLDEWKNCEQDYTIRLLKNAGEQARIVQN